MVDSVSDETARNRWAVIQAMRIAGVVMVLVGILIARQVIAAPALAGYALIVVGLLDVFMVPMVLARKWRTPPE